MIIKPVHVKRLSKLLARIAPNYCASQLKNPFFIIGSARSGTTLLVNTLALHRGIAVYPGEANNLWHPQTYPWRYSKHRSDLPPLWVDPEKFSRLSLKYRSPSQENRTRSIFGAYQFLRGKRCFLNKSAMITFMIPFILEEFPTASFIHLIRDGRAVALSHAKRECIKINENLDTYKKHGYDLSFREALKTCAKSWRLHIEEVEKQGKRFKLKNQGVFLEVRYEDFCANPRDCLEQIAHFMDIAPDGFEEISHSHINSTNYKYKEELPDDTVRELTEIMSPALRAKGYL